MRLRTAVLVALVVAATPTSVAADVERGATGASGALTNTGGAANVWGIGVSGREPRRGGGASEVVCRYYRGAGGFGTVGVGEPATDLQPGNVVIRICEDRTTGRTVSGPAFVTIGEPNSAATLDALIDQAMANLDVDLPDPVSSPANGMTLPNIDTWFWITNTAPQTRSASAAGITATVRSTLVDVTFDLGAEGTLRCPGGGTPYDVSRPARTQRSECAHAFAAPTRTVDIDVTATWRITWSASTGASGDLGTVSRTSTLPMRIEERFTVIRGA